MHRRHRRPDLAQCAPLGGIVHLSCRRAALHVVDEEAARRIVLLVPHGEGHQHHRDQERCDGQAMILVRSFTVQAYPVARAQPV
jgi:hypothetical protein